MRTQEEKCVFSAHSTTLSSGHQVPLREGPGWRVRNLHTVWGMVQQVIPLPKIHFSWCWDRMERWGKKFCFLQRRKKKEKTSSPNLAFQKLAAVCQDLTFITQDFEDQLSLIPTIGFSFHIWRAWYPGKYNYIKLKCVWIAFLVAVLCPTEKGAPPQPLPGTASPAYEVWAYLGCCSRSCCCHWPPARCSCYSSSSVLFCHAASVH